MSLSHYAREAQKRQKKAWRKAQGFDDSLSGRIKRLGTNTRERITGTVESLAAYVSEKRDNHYFSQQDKARLEEEREVWRSARESTPQEQEFLGEINADMNSIAGTKNPDDKDFLQRVNADLDAIVEDSPRAPTLQSQGSPDPLRTLPNTAQAYLLNQQVNEQRVDEATIAQLGKHASILAALTPQEQEQTLDILLSQQDSFQQGKGPTTILKEVNPELHQTWLNAKEHPQKTPRVTEPLPTAFSNDYVNYPKPFYERVETGLKRTALASLLLAGIIGGVHHLTKEPYPSQTTTQENVTLSSQNDLTEVHATPQDTLFESSFEHASTEPSQEQSKTFDEILRETPVFEPDYTTPTTPVWSGSWNEDFQGQILTTEVTFESGQQLYKTFLDAGIPKDIARASVEKTALDNNWYSSQRITEDGLREGEDPLELDSYPWAGKTYTLTIDATLPQQTNPQPTQQAQIPVESCDSFAWNDSMCGQKTTCTYDSQPNDTLLGVFYYEVGVPQELVDSSLASTGLENNLYPDRCVLEQDGEKTFSSDCDVREDFLANRFQAVKPYTIVVDATLPSTLCPSFSRENNYGGNFNIETPRNDVFTYK